VTFERITAAPVTLLGTTVTPLRLRHGVFDVLGFRFGNVAYCTDTNFIPDETWPLLEGLDVLVLDCLRFTRHPTHFSADEALAAAARIKAKRTILVHMAHDIRHAALAATLPAGVELAVDGLEVPLT
jgi:phosphoribosyl 1,2-cyclic phosphate phosphodiesterase